MKTNTVKQMIKALITHGVTQEQIAVASGLTQGRISQISLSPEGSTVSCAYENGKKLEDFFSSFELTKASNE